MSTRKDSQNPQVKIKGLIKKLHGLMQAENLNEVLLEEKDSFKIKLRRQGSSSPVPAYNGPVQTGESQDTEVNIEEKKENTAQYIRSPMNGVFYRAPSPGAPPFVKESDDVAIGQTLCIIEAMKLMNEVQVERHCKIIRTLVENGESVKVGQPLFEIENK
jgi:acetyl-CoA carboxylase biotin carboxyl carrier protein